VAVIVGCADSRVPPEILFDQGVGDLFVVRAAGNVISGAGAVVKGSIEYAVAELGVSLVMVLGHTQCGAVKAALKHIGAGDALPGAIQELVNAIKPAVARAKGRPGDALENAVRANVELGVERLQSLEPVLSGPVRRGEVKVVGGVYDLHTGGVTVVP
jgi:carbonic anhydrase